MSKQIFTRNNATSPIEKAQEIIWAMDNVLRWDAPKPKKGNFLIRDDKECARLWASHGGDKSQVPKLDFNKYMMAAMFLDSGSYKIAPSIKRVTKEGDVVVIEYAMCERPWEMIDPCCVLKVEKVDGMYIFQELK